ncbi:MAG: Flp pilus assembly complex ATPase component TadA, partial [Phycisphaerales bacterium]|nr:Flp pilus assembly complex ATPase component TadA [Phycisphaerales bacterium]
PSDIITYFKQLGRLDAGDRRRRQRAIIKAIRGTETRELKLVTDGSGAGMRLSVTIDPTKQVNLRIDDLGLLPHQREIWDRITSSANGTVLIAGGLHQGRTNTLFSLIESHDAYLTNVQTLEIEEQRLIEGVRHNVFDPATEDSDFWTTLRAIMRRDPDVMGIAEMVDAQTAVQIAQAGLDGPRMYFSLRADNALQGLQVYMKAVDDPELAAAGLIGLIGIRLMRRLCETCRVPYQPTEEAIRKLNLPAGRVKQLHKAGGKVILKGHNPETCPECGGSGYLGQTGVYELLEIGEEERQLISNKDLQGLRAVLRKKKGMFIPDVALAKVIEGTTSIEEVNRVLRSAGSAKKRRSGRSELQKKA